MRLWNAYRGGDLAAGHLPAAGGMMDQPACVLDCFAIMDATYQAVRPKTE